VLIVAASISTFFINYEENISQTYVLSKGFSLENPAAFDEAVRSNEYVAVMFKSPTCPVCKRMYPYWLRLEATQGKVKFYDVTYSQSTAPLFQRFDIEDVPTFMVFKNGKLIAKHIGGFGGSNITKTMMEWVYGALGLRVKGPDYWYSAFISSCARCHGAPPSLNKTSIEGWLHDPISSQISGLILKAASRGMTLSEYLGGFDKLEEKVSTMKKYVNLNKEQIESTSRFLDYVSSILIGKDKQYLKKVLGSTNTTQSQVNMMSKKTEYTKLSESNVGAYAAVFSFIVGLAAGIASALSPCVFPLFITHLTSSIKRKENSVTSAVSCAILAALGVTLLGLLFLVFSDAVLSIQKLLLPIVGVAVLAAGLAPLLDIPMEITTAKFGKGGQNIFCALYGFLSVQCNLPLVIGALLLIATAGGVSTLAGFALGIGVPLAIASYMAPKAKNLVITITNKSKEIELISSILLVIAGIYLIMYSFGVVT